MKELLQLTGAEFGCRYYERQGFTLVKDFLFEKPDGSTWPGSLLELDLEKHNV